jgi:hypothetical protein
VRIIATASSIEICSIRSFELSSINSRPNTLRNRTYAQNKVKLFTTTNKIFIKEKIPIDSNSKRALSSEDHTKHPTPFWHNEHAKIRAKLSFSAKGKLLTQWKNVNIFEKIKAFRIEINANENIDQAIQNKKKITIRMSVSPEILAKEVCILSGKLGIQNWLDFSP